jgi:hypothetical protein
VLVCALALPVSTARAWTWPVDGPVLRPFVFDHDTPYAAGQHRGIDIEASSGTPVLAPADGVVAFAGTVPTGGKTISIQTPLGYTATLLHLGSIDVKRGAVVREGAVVGAAGTEPYVYFGVRTTSDPQGYVDPLGLLPAAPSAAPAPTPVVQAPAQPEVPAEVAVTPSVAATQASVDASAPTIGDGLVVSGRVEARRGVVVSSRSREERAVVQRPAQQLRPVSAMAKPSGRGDAAVDTGPAHSPRSQLREHIRSDADVRLPTAIDVATSQSSSRNPLLLISALLVACALALVLRHRSLKKAARIMSSPKPELIVVRTETEEDPRRTGVAVCVGEAAPRPRGRVRGASRHLRALPPVAGQRRPDGQRDRRARDAGDGDRGSRRRVAA